MAAVSHEAVPLARHQWTYRHSVVVRFTHWINVICLTILLMSGLAIFNADPALSWGKTTDFEHPLVQMKAEFDKNGEPIKGITTVFGHDFTTTGFLGLSADDNGTQAQRGFPGWITLPGHQDLATARHWHFFFAWLFVLNGLVFIVSGVLSGHFKRDLMPDKAELRDIGPSIIDHLHLRFPKGDAARRYNVLQKLSYLAVIFFLLPLMVAAGMSLSPGLDAILGLTWIFGGRQSGRTLHFILANFIIVFALVHITMVLVSGVWNNIRSMLTGRYDVDSTGGPGE